MRWVFCLHRGQHASDRDEAMISISSSDVTISCCTRKPSDAGSNHSMSFSRGSVADKIDDVFILHCITCHLVELIIKSLEEPRCGYSIHLAHPPPSTPGETLRGWGRVGLVEM